MISLQKIPIKTTAVDLAKKTVQKSLSNISQKTSTEVSNLGNMPCFYPVGKNFLKTANSILKEFQSEYEVKSSTYLCEQIKQAKKQQQPDNILNEMLNLRKKYSFKIKKMRRELSNGKFSSFEEYVSFLKNYIKKNGAYMNCSECSDIIQDKFNQKGIKSNNVLLYSVNNKGDRTSFAEHVFTVIGLDKNAQIKNPKTWGKDAVICDGWANIARPADKGIEFYEKFFDIDKTKNNFEFCFVDKFQK